MCFVFELFLLCIANPIVACSCAQPAPVPGPGQGTCTDRPSAIYARTKRSPRHLELHAGGSWVGRPGGAGGRLKRTPNIQMGLRPSIASTSSSNLMIQLSSIGSTLLSAERLQSPLLPTTQTLVEFTSAPYASTAICVYPFGLGCRPSKVPSWLGVR